MPSHDHSSACNEMQSMMIEGLGLTSCILARAIPLCMFIASCKHTASGNHRHEDGTYRTTFDGNGRSTVVAPARSIVTQRDVPLSPTEPMLLISGDADRTKAPHPASYHRTSFLPGAGEAPDRPGHRTCDRALLSFAGNPSNVSAASTRGCIAHRKRRPGSVRSVSGYDCQAIVLRFTWKGR